MTMISFSDWVLKGGQVFAGESVPVQTGGTSVVTTAGGIPSGKPTAKPTVHSMDIGVVEIGVPDNSAHQKQIKKPTIFDPYVFDDHDEAIVADEYAQVYTPSINLTDVFSTNMNP